MWLANLLANKQLVSPLLNYLISTDIEDKERERKGVVKKNKRINQKTEK